VIGHDGKMLDSKTDDQNVRDRCVRGVRCGQDGQICHSLNDQEEGPLDLVHQGILCCFLEEVFFLDEVWQGHTDHAQPYAALPPEVEICRSDRVYHHEVDILVISDEFCLHVLLEETLLSVCWWDYHA